MSPQTQEALKRSLITVGAIIIAGLVAVLPQITSDAPLNTQTLIRVFVGACIAAIASHYGQGAFDAKRADAVRKGDTTRLLRSDVGEHAAMAHFVEVQPKK